MFREALKTCPGSGPIHALLGSALHSAGLYDEAMEALSNAVRISPGIAEAHNDLGLVYEAKDQFKQAIACFREALNTKPDLFPARMNLARALQHHGDHHAAIDLYRKIVESTPTFFQAHHNLAAALEATGQLTESVAYYQSALKLRPTNLTTQIGLVRLLSNRVPTWHIPMMNDYPRNDAYREAIRLTVTPDSNVFEIGTGSGLLSLMAARQGANKVVTCEAEPVIADAAKRIIQTNGLSEKIAVVPKRSSDVMVGRDLPDRADLFIHEVFSSELLSEGVLASIEDAKRRLLNPGCKMIPAKASIRVALFGGKELASNLFADEVYGFDLREFNDVIPSRQQVFRNDLQIEILSDETDAFLFDFENDAEWAPEEKNIQLNITREGYCLGIVQWIRLYFHNDILFENHPGSKTPATSWPPCVYLASPPSMLKKEQSATVVAAHDTKLPYFWLQGIE